MRSTKMPCKSICIIMWPNPVIKVMRLDRTL